MKNCMELNPDEKEVLKKVGANVVMTSPIGSLEILTCNSSDLRFDCMTFATHPLSHKRHTEKERFLAKLLGSLPLIDVSNCMQHCLPKSCTNPFASKMSKKSPLSLSSSNT